MSDKVFVGPMVSDLDIGGKARRISRVNILVDSGHQYTSGDDTGRTLEKTVPWGSQEMADSILAAVRNYDYQPFTGTDALLDPAAEIGDGITIGGIYSILAQKDTSFGKLSTSEISAPMSDEIEDEYPYISKSEREANRRLAQTYSYITKTSEEIKLGVKNDMQQQSTEFSIELGKVQTTIEDKINGLSTSITADLNGIRTRVEKTETSIDGINTSVSEIKQSAEKISTRVEKTEEGINGLNKSVSTIEQTAEKITTRVEATEQGIDGLTKNVSTIEQYAKSIRLSVTNGTDSSSFQLTAGTAVLSSGSIKFSGMVTFTDLTSNGNTKINGDYITTGTISADRIDVSNLKFDTLWGTDTKIAIQADSSTIHIGGVNSLNTFSTSYLHGSTITFNKWGDIKSGLVIDNTNYTVRPGTSNVYSLGMSSYKFSGVYATYLYAMDSSNQMTISGNQIYTNDSSHSSIGTSSRHFNAGYFNYLYIGDIYITPSTIYASSGSWNLGMSTRPWTNGYFTNLYVNGTKFDPSSLSVTTNKLQYSSTVIATLNSSKQFIPDASTGYYIGSSSYPWEYGYFKNLYINGNPLSVNKLTFSSTNEVLLDSTRHFRPSDSTNSYYFGASNYPWYDVYTTSLHVLKGSIQLGSAGGSYGGAKLGFFGTTPITQLSISTTSNNQGYTSATANNYLTILNNIAGILKKYGLVSS